MAGRKDKKTVTYFPHYCENGKTLYIIENKYGNDGYAVLFKTLEILGTSENHYFDFRDIESQEFMSAKTKVDIPELIKIYDTLSNLGTIHKELWEQKIIYSPNFVKNIQDAYKRRNNLCMQFEDLCMHLCIKCKHKYDLWGVLVSINTQSKVKKNKEEQSKQEKSIYKTIPPTLEMVSLEIQQKQYKVDAKRFMAYYDSNGWKVGRNSMKDWGATLTNWNTNELNKNNGTTQQHQKNGFGNNSKFGETEIERQRQIANELLAERGYQTIEPAGSSSDTEQAV